MVQQQFDGIEHRAGRSLRQRQRQVQHGQPLRIDTGPAATKAGPHVVSLHQHLQRRAFRTLAPQGAGQQPAALGRHEADLHCVIPIEKKPGTEVSGMEPMKAMESKGKKRRAASPAPGAT